ncbi:hypothetical protein [Cytobacillus oceanisediminis]|nr:hypothetical protein [Cytobacillus oceanisediminis]
MKLAVDDHSIDAFRVWYDLEYEELKKEWTSGKYDILLIALL